MVSIKLCLQPQRTLINRHTPVFVFLVAAAYGVEKNFAEFFRYRPHLSGADGAIIDAGDGGNLRAGAGEKHFLRQINFAAIDRAFHNVHAELVAEQRHHRLARDASDDFVGNRIWEN